MAHLRRLTAEEEAMARAGLGWTDPRVVARVALKDEDAIWDHLPGVPERPDELEIEEGWLDGFVEGALEVLEAADGRRG